MIYGYLLTIFTSFLLLGAQTAPVFGAAGGELYVSPSGADSNDGSLESPFASVQRCADAVQPGGTCILREGVYRETVTPPISGTAAEPITFTNFEGERAELNGADIVTNFASDGDVLRASVSTDLGVGNNQLFIDGEMQLEARWPNVEPANISTPEKARARRVEGGGNSWTLELDSAPPAEVGNAKINVGIGLMEHTWIHQTGAVDSINGQRVKLTPIDPFNRDVVQNATVHLWGSRELIDAPGEWVVQGGELYLNYANTDAQVELKSRNSAFDLSGRGHIIIKGLELFASTITTDDASYFLTLDALNVLYPSHFTEISRLPWSAGSGTGVMLHGSNHTLKNSTIAFSAGNGVSLNGRNHLVENNVVHDVSYAGTDNAAVTTRCGACEGSSSGHIIRSNTLYNSGRSIIVHRKTQALTIEYNHMYNAGLQTYDNGMTYSFETEGGGSVIAHNLIHSNKAGGLGVGIYLDNGSDDFIVHHNIVYDVSEAMRLNLPSRNNLVYYNTLLGRDSSLASWAPSTRPKTSSGTAIANNIAPNGISIEHGASESNNLDRDANFVNANGGDLQLSQGSPAIDAGQVIVGVKDVFEGSSPDLGALEFGSQE